PGQDRIDPPFDRRIQRLRTGTARRICLRDDCCQQKRDTAQAHDRSKQESPPGKSICHCNGRSQGEWNPPLSVDSDNAAGTISAVANERTSLTKTRPQLRREPFWAPLEVDAKQRSFWPQVLAFNGGFVLLDDAITGAEAETGALSQRLGRIKRIEDARGFGDSWSGIRDFYDYMAVMCAGSHRNFSATHFLDGVSGVVQHMQEDLQQMVVVTNHRGQIRLQIASQQNLSRQAADSELARVIDERIDVRQPHLRRSLAR